MKRACQDLSIDSRISGVITQLGSDIRESRRSAGATQDEWARQLGISRPTFIRIESGDFPESAKTLIKAMLLAGVGGLRDQ